MDLQAVKKKLKVWECDFKTAHKNKPTKDDINAASQNIKDLYKEYTRLKNCITDDVWTSKPKKMQSGSSSESDSTKTSGQTTFSVIDTIGDKLTIKAGKHVHKLNTSSSSKKRTNVTSAEQSSDKENGDEKNTRNTRCFLGKSLNISTFSKPKKLADVEEREAAFSRPACRTAVPPGWLQMDQFENQGSNVKSKSGNSEKQRDVIPSFETDTVGQREHAVNTGTHSKFSTLCENVSGMSDSYKNETHSADSAGDWTGDGTTSKSDRTVDFDSDDSFDELMKLNTEKKKKKARKSKETVKLPQGSCAKNSRKEKPQTDCEGNSLKRKAHSETPGATMNQEQTSANDDDDDLEVADIEKELNDIESHQPDAKKKKVPTATLR